MMCRGANVNEAMTQEVDYDDGKSWGNYRLDNYRGGVWGRERATATDLTNIHGTIEGTLRSGDRRGAVRPRAGARSGPAMQ
mmetsp:Transcript_3237/g.7164  ORF Transcript_3237/g.7164 Transcript_3237/m.7164 type:complete len:81 (-) Transcript_3237:718-960(-)